MTLPTEIWSFIGGVAVGAIGASSWSMWFHRRRKLHGGVGGDDQAMFRRAFGPRQ